MSLLSVQTYPRSALSSKSKKDPGTPSKKSVRFASELTRGSDNASDSPKSVSRSPTLDTLSVPNINATTTTEKHDKSLSPTVSPRLVPAESSSPVPPKSSPKPPKIVSKQKRSPPSPETLNYNTPAPQPTAPRVPVISIIPSEMESKPCPSKCPYEQGTLNDCWLLSPALSFWRSPNITSQFAKQTSKFCYLIRLWTIGCEWESYRVHASNLPASEGVTILAPFADYVRYIEGAFLGYFNGTESLAKAVGDPAEAFVWLTGGFAERLLLNQSDPADRRIFTLMSDKSFFTTVQQSNEKQRHSCSIVQWERLPFGTGYRYLVIDSNVADEAENNHNKKPNKIHAIQLSNSFSSLNSLGSAVSTTSSLSSINSARRIQRSGSSITIAGKTSPVNHPGSSDSKTELIAQIAKTHPNLTVGSFINDDKLGLLTGWYTPQRLLSTFDVCTICRPLLHEDKTEVQGRLVQIMSSWIPGVNSGGSRRNLDDFATNPQFIFKLHLVGAPGTMADKPPGPAWSRIDGTIPWLWVSLSQAFRFDKMSYSHIAFHAYKLLAKEPPAIPLRPSFFLHTAEIFSSLPYANYSMTTRSYSDTSIPNTPPTIPRFTSALSRPTVDLSTASAAEIYILIVPSTYFPVKTRTEFLLRVYSEIGEVTFDTAFNFDPKTVNVPWNLFNPNSVDFKARNQTASASSESVQQSEKS